jgi:hypothetical protein
VARKPAPASVVRIEPSETVLPENLLKFYLYFSAPMSRGEVYEHVHLRETSGRVVEAPFLEIGEELWDPSGTRLTLLLDPGRIKRGLRPREEDGPILESAKSYCLQIDRDWHDASGQRLQKSFSQTFRAGPPDRIQPNPTTWKILAPAATSQAQLVLVFPEPLDRAMLDRAILIRDPNGRRVDGSIEVSDASKRWSFRPKQPWAEGPFVLEVDTELEDLAGNSVGRPFEVDALRVLEKQSEIRYLRVPFAIRVAPQP